MYIVVQYGKEEKEVFNANCRCLLLLDALKKRIESEDDVELDVSDEQGNVKLLRENLDKYAVEMLTEREKLVLLRVNRSESGDCTYTPLLENQQIVTDTFKARLSSRVVGGPTHGRRGNRGQLNAQQSVAGGSSSNGSTAGNRRAARTNVRSPGSPEQSASSTSTASAAAAPQGRKISVGGPSVVAAAAGAGTTTASSAPRGSVGGTKAKTTAKTS